MGLIDISVLRMLKACSTKLLLFSSSFGSFVCEGFLRTSRAARMRETLIVFCLPFYMYCSGFDVSSFPRNNV